MELPHADVPVQRHRLEQLLLTVVAPDAIPTNRRREEVAVAPETTRTPLVLQHQAVLVASLSPAGQQSLVSPDTETLAAQGFNKRVKVRSTPPRGVAVAVAAQVAQGSMLHRMVQELEVQENSLRLPAPLKFLPVVVAVQAVAAMLRVLVTELQAPAAVSAVLAAVAPGAVTPSTALLLQAMAQQTPEAVAVAARFAMAPTTPAAAVEAAL